MSSEHIRSYVSWKGSKWWDTLLFIQHVETTAYKTIFTQSKTFHFWISILKLAKHPVWNKVTHGGAINA